MASSSSRASSWSATEENTGVWCCTLKTRLRLLEEHEEQTRRIADNVAFDITRTPRQATFRPIEENSVQRTPPPTLTKVHCLNTEENSSSPVYSRELSERTQVHIGDREHLLSKTTKLQQGLLRAEHNLSRSTWGDDFFLPGPAEGLFISSYSDDSTGSGEFSEGESSSTDLSAIGEIAESALREASQEPNEELTLMSLFESLSICCGFRRGSFVLTIVLPLAEKNIGIEFNTMVKGAIPLLKRSAQLVQSDDLQCRITRSLLTEIWESLSQSRELPLTFSRTFSRNPNSVAVRKWLVQAEYDQAESVQAKLDDVQADGAGKGNTKKSPKKTKSDSPEANQTWLDCKGNKWQVKSSAKEETGTSSQRAAGENTPLKAELEVETPKGHRSSNSDLKSPSLEDIDWDQKILALLNEWEAKADGNWKTNREEISKALGVNFWHEQFGKAFTRVRAGNLELFDKGGRRPGPRSPAMGSPDTIMDAEEKRMRFSSI